MTQAQQDVLTLLLPPRDMLPEIADLVGDNPAWLRWLSRMEDIHAGLAPHIIGSLSDAELQALWNTAETADLWASIT